MATNLNEVPIGSIVYICHLKKYVVMEDDCTACDNEWWSAGGYWLDIWQGPQYWSDQTQLDNCEGHISTYSAMFIVNPPDWYPVDTTPLFNPSNGECTANLYDSYCNYL